MSRLPADTAHRPWPLPRSPWVMSMRWSDLAFLHWPVEHAALRPLVHAGLELGTFEGKSWLGVTPFLMDRTRARYLPSMFRLPPFLELNVRTYVSVEGKPGVWFFSLDAANPLAVIGARWVFGLPYHDAHMKRRTSGQRIDYRSIRSTKTGQHARFRGSYEPSGPSFHARPGSLEHWLTERYCLYSAKRGRLYRGDIHHGPWPLQPAAAQIEENTMASPLGVDVSGPPLAHFAHRLDVVAWPPHAVA